ncbi:MAG TPA: leucyl/phenylalanyl-tRNA--protein transferase [Xanthomonadales bacterium]|nr:leucyl/phenylalanyl-tRNA--protein transferase [Xanthomonadales bacterium]
MSELHLPLLGYEPDAPFPDTRDALLHPNGLLAWGGDLSPPRLLNAYRLGIFPWYSDDEPVLWWSPAPRCVLFPEAVHLSRRTRRRYNSGGYTITADTAFSRVIAACATPRKPGDGTWITGEMQSAFELLYELGHAHSVEVWSEGLLIGGVYGLALGRIFFGESMFSRQTDASKIGLVALCKQLHDWGFGLFDCQVPNPHLKSMGAVVIPRAQFEEKLRIGISQPFHIGAWADIFAVKNRW